MKDKMKKILYVGGLTLALATGYVTGKDEGINKGYELGKQITLGKITKFAGFEIANCKHNERLFKDFKLYHSENSTEEKRFQTLSEFEREKRDIVEGIVRIVESNAQ